MSNGLQNTLRIYMSNPNNLKMRILPDTPRIIMFDVQIVQRLYMNTDIRSG